MLRVAIQYFPDHALDVSVSVLAPREEASSICILMCDGEKEWCAKDLLSTLTMSNVCSDVGKLTINPQNGKQNSHAS